MLFITMVLIMIRQITYMRPRSKSIIDMRSRRNSAKAPSAWSSDASIINARKLWL